ncbi:MAG: sigma-70 family RNA polymerase sigma factor [Phycisphaerae bacterium]|nr:sigma-70 family RNA polymerase sigma factor [Phycisphaerae bacterium]
MHSRTTHATLLDRLATADDRAAWHEFCARYGDLIRGFMRRAGCTEDESDDLLQDVMMSLMKVMPSFRYDPAKGRFRGYLKTVVVRAIAKRRCQKRPEVPLESGADMVDGSTVGSDELWEVEWRQYHLRMAMTAIESEFSAQDRSAFQRYAVGGGSAQETADLLGLSVDQVYQAKSRILKRLAELIAAQVADEG